MHTAKELLDLLSSGKFWAWYRATFCRDFLGDISQGPKRFDVTEQQILADIEEMFQLKQHLEYKKPDEPYAVCMTCKGSGVVNSEKFKVYNAVCPACVGFGRICTTR